MAGAKRGEGLSNRWDEGRGGGRISKWPPPEEGRGWIRDGRR